MSKTVKQYEEDSSEGWVLNVVEFYIGNRLVEISKYPFPMEAKEAIRQFKLV